MGLRRAWLFKVSECPSRGCWKQFLLSRFYEHSLNPFDHYIKMKAYMRVEVGGGGTLYPRVDCPPPTDYVHRDKIWEIVSSLLLKGIQKLQMNDQALPNPFDHYIKMKAYMKVEGGTLYPGVDCPHHPLLTMFIGTRYEKLFPASSWRAFRNFQWPGFSQSLRSLHKNESIHEGWGGGGTSPRGRLSPPPPHYWLCSQRQDMRNCFQHPFKGHLETTNNQALFIPFIIKIKACMRVEGRGGDTLPRDRFSPPSPPPFFSFPLS